MSDERDYYSILQVNRKASPEEIDRAYERLSQLYDPSRSKKRRAAERMELVQHAYDVLSDPAQRAAYDRSLGSSISVPGFGGGETIFSRFLTSRYGLPSLAGLVAAIAVAALLVSVFSGDGDSNGTPNPTGDSGPPPVSGEEITTDSGLTYIEITPGTGEAPVLGDTVSVHYTGWLESDGSVFDSSEGGDPREFVVGNVIEGWNEGLQLMRAGAKNRLIIPPELAYGSAGRPGIPPDSTLIFDVELLAVNPTPAPTPSPTDTRAASGSPEPTGTADPTATLEPTPGEATE